MVGPPFDAADVCSTTIVSEEIRLLSFVHEQGGRANLPILLYHTADFQELGTTPVGSPMDPLTPAREVCDVLRDILDALRWLHGHNIIHRNVRWDNVVTIPSAADGHPLTGILIDFGESFRITPERKETVLRGGYLCCPPEIIQEPHSDVFPTPTR